jgi:hypothetical protein
VVLLVVVVVVVEEEDENPNSLLINESLSVLGCVLLLLLAEVGSSVIPFSSCSPFTSLTE